MPGQPKAMPSAMVPSVVQQNLTADTNSTTSTNTNTASTNLTKTPAPIVERRGEKQIPVKVENLPPVKSEPAKVVETPKVEPKVVEKPKKEPVTQIAEVPRTPPKSRPGIAVSRDPSIKDAPAVTPTPGFIKTSSDPTVQLRRGPSGVYRTVMRLSRGDQVEIIGRRDGWYKSPLKRPRRLRAREHDQLFETYWRTLPRDSTAAPRGSCSAPVQLVC